MPDHQRPFADLRLGDILGPNRFVLWSPRVSGVEVTQTIQHHRAAQHLTDASDRGANNSVRLIASKPAWVRVYVRSGWFSESVSGMSGTLELERRSGGFVWNPVTTYSPRAPGTVTARRSPAYDTERSNIGDTLNFVIPATEFWGNLRLTVRLVNASGNEVDTHTVNIDATLRQTLRIRSIMVAYNGPATSATPPPGAPPVPNLTLAAPTLANLQATAALSLRAMPVQSQGSFASAGTITCTVPLDDPRSCPGCCSTNWGTLLQQLGTQRTNDGNRTDVVYYGLLPAAIPLNVPGCGSGGLGSAVVGDQGTLMHEIGHGYGFQHTPCGNGGAADPSYPTYEPYASASIGEYGLDIADGTIYRPASTFDYMSYCGPQWMSLYQHDRLIGHARIGSEWLRDDLVFDRWKKYRDYKIWRDLPYPPEPDPYRWDQVRVNPVIAISGIVHGPGKVEVRSVARVAAAGSPPGARTKLVAALVGGDGDVLARGVLRRLSAHGGGCSCGEGDGHAHGDDGEDEAQYAFEVYLPDVDLGDALVIEEGDERLWERRRPDARPEVGRVDADVSDEGLVLRWDALESKPRGSGGRRSAAKEADGNDATDTWVQWSSDDGVTWFGLTTGLAGRDAVLDIGGLPAGPVLVRVLVNDGFSTAASDPVRVEIPERGPTASILHPDEGGIYMAGGTIRLWAAVNDGGGHPIPDAWCRWLLDGREIAQGVDEFVDAPGPGEHRLELLVRGKGAEAEASVTFECRGGGGPATAVPRRG